MEELIMHLINSKDAVCVYVNTSTDRNSFIFGRFLVIDKIFAVLQRFSPAGRDDGLLVLLIDSIIRIETSSKYIIKMQKLLLEDMEYDSYMNYASEEGCLVSVIKCAIQNHKIVSIELLESGNTDIAGIVDSMRGELVSIQQINEYGEDDGKVFIKINTITQLSLESEDEKILSRLL